MSELFAENNLVVMQVCEADEAYLNYLLGQEWDCVIINRKEGRWVGKIVDVIPKKRQMKRKRTKRKKRGKKRRR